jgi:hypothetical protein
MCASISSFTDVGMPNLLSGFPMVDAARLKRPALGVLFITGYPLDIPREADTHMLMKSFTLDRWPAGIGAIIGTS